MLVSYIVNRLDTLLTNNAPISAICGVHGAVGLSSHSLRKQQMGQAERDRRRVEHLEIERQFMAQKAKEQANLLQPLDPSEALNNPEADGEWGECAIDQRKQT